MTWPPTEIGRIADDFVPHRVQFQPVQILDGRQTLLIGNPPFDVVARSSAITTHTLAQIGWRGVARAPVPRVSEATGLRGTVTGHTRRDRVALQKLEVSVERDTHTVPTRC